jgi:thioredoxin 1
MRAGARRRPAQDGPGFRGASAMSNLVQTVTDSSFEMKVLKGGLPVLVFFYTEWSGTARRMAPLIDEIAHTYMDRLAVAKLDTDAEPLTMADQKVRIIPTLILYLNGTPLATAPNVPNIDALKEWLDKYLP